MSVVILAHISRRCDVHFKQCWSFYTHSAHLDANESKILLHSKLTISTILITYLRFYEGWNLFEEILAVIKLCKNR